MIGKVKIGKSFGGCVRYNLEREQVSILHGEGIRIGLVKHIIEDFNFQRKMNPNLGKAVGHVVLSWSRHDKPKLSSEAMLQNAREYMKKMKIRDTQHLIIRHEDREHPHVHLIYNRVDNQGKTISDQYQHKRNIEVCRKITEKYGYHLAKGKTEVKRPRLIGADKVKYEIYDALNKALTGSKSWQQLEGNLSKENIQIHYKLKGGANEVQGISFSKGNAKFKGSEIDRKFSYSKLNGMLAVQRLQEVKTHLEGRPDSSEISPFTSHHGGARKTMLETLVEPIYIDEQGVKEFERESKRKRKKRSRGILR